MLRNRFYDLGGMIYGKALRAFSFIIVLTSKRWLYAEYLSE